MLIGHPHLTFLRPCDFILIRFHPASVPFMPRFEPFPSTALHITPGSIVSVFILRIRELIYRYDVDGVIVSKYETLNHLSWSFGAYTGNCLWANGVPYMYNLDGIAD